MKILKMTIPRKHHYVPQTHIKKFECERGYFVYHKDIDKIIPKKSSNDIFVVKDLNTSIDENGDLDHISVENEFGEKWDSKFNFHFDLVTSWIQDSVENNKCYQVDIYDSLIYFFEYALIGFHRSQKKDKEFNESVLGPIRDFAELIPELDNLDLSGINYNKDEIEIGLSSIKDFINLATTNVAEWQDKLRFPAPIATSLRMLVPSEISCKFYISLDKSFYLPDTTAIISLSEEEFEYQNRKINKIALVGIPISSRVYLQIKNRELFTDEKTGIYIYDNDDVDVLNNKIFSHAKKEVLVNEDFSLRNSD